MSDSPIPHHGFEALRRALLAVAPDTGPRPALAGGSWQHWLLAAVDSPSQSPSLPPQSSRGPHPGAHVRPQAGPRGTAPGPDQAPDQGPTSSEDDPTLAAHLIALVERARSGDAEAFGLLFDHYHPQVYRFVYYRTGSVPLAEDLTSEAFVRALRNVTGFTWQGRDFGAWLTTIARNLVADHYKSARNRLERPTEDERVLDSHTESPEGEVLASLTNEVLLEAVRTLPEEQQTCVVLRFLEGRSIAEVAAALGRSEGAVKQLQLRAVRNLAKRLPEGLR